MRVSPTALGSVASWDPIVVAAVERCRAASTAAQSFAGCPFLDQAGAAIFSRGCSPADTLTPVTHQR